MKSLIPAVCLLLIGAGSHAQTAYAVPAAYSYSGAGGSHDRDGIKSNVPLNEINIHAFRHFSKKYRRISDEAWFKTGQGYTVVFTDNSRLNRVFYGVRGNFLCGVSYYPGTEIDKDTGLLINRKFPGYEIGVVTAINDGENTVYLVTIKNSLSVKTLSVCNGIIETRDEQNDLVNGG
jgi:hypothetical protein